MADEGWTFRVASWAWDRREEIQKKLGELFAWFRGGEAGQESAPGILIIGPGGSGKTTLGRMLSGRFDLLFDPPGTYDESIVPEHFTLVDSPAVEIVVPPGQPHRRESTWGDIHAEIAAGRYKGIVILTSYGYHSIGRISYKDHSLYRGDKNSFLASFLESRRGDELAVLRELGPHLRANRGDLWLLTLVAKQDLWWPRRAEVEAHYRGGAYGEELAHILAQVDRRRVQHELRFASLVISNFSTGLDERLKPNAEGYDQRMHVESLRAVFETIDALRSRGSSR